MPASKGILLGIEGIDAVGKKTQTQLLNFWLRRKKFEVNLFTFPDYKTPIGREIKAFLAGKRNHLPQVRHMLFAANRWEKYQQLKTSIRKGGIVVVNRYTESNLVYGRANGLEVKWLQSLEQGLPRTDLVIVLDASPRLVSSRRHSKKDVYEVDIRLQDRVRRTYKQLAKKFGWKVIDASFDVQTIHREVVKTISAELPRID